MKINTSWSQADWDNALNKVWKLSKDFEEILNFGLEHGYITSSDIIHASDIYKDPNKEYDDDEIKGIISSRGLRDILGIIQEEYSLYDILDELPKNEILDEYDDYDLLEKLEGTWTMNDHDDKVREQTYREYIDEWIDNLNKSNKEQMEMLQDSNADELRQFFCNLFRISYYDDEGFFKGFQNLLNKLEKSSYKDKWSGKLILNKIENNE